MSASAYQDVHAFHARAEEGRGSTAQARGALRRVEEEEGLRVLAGAEVRAADAAGQLNVVGGAAGPAAQAALGATANLLTRFAAALSVQLEIGPDGKPTLSHRLDYMAALEVALSLTGSVNLPLGDIAGGLQAAVSVAMSNGQLSLSASLSAMLEHTLALAASNPGDPAVRWMREVAASFALGVVLEAGPGGKLELRNYSRARLSLAWAAEAMARLA
ncbi:hypothetical protein [Calidithermus chliarophilus]|uniref:hypothetical protein n=1 Tax=Calidithermus chliarophilus TaxID=52023 RepID=UPI000405F2F3|nr:hypothetical protein [Calidithermus chliarophilus]